MTTKVYIPAKPYKFDEERKERYLEQVKRTGALVRSCVEVGIDYTTVRALRRADPAFEQAVKDALDLYLDALKTEATRRAYEGWEERPVLGKDGNIVGHVHRYSDHLMLALLKRYDPGFREHVSVEAAVQTSQKESLQVTEEQLRQLSPAAQRGLRAALEELQAAQARPANGQPANTTPGPEREVRYPEPTTNASPEEKPHNALED